MKDIRIALLDMNNNHVNQGFRNIKEISEAFQQNSEENVIIKTFDVRFKDEMPEIGDFDIFILQADRVILTEKALHGKTGLPVF